jgi:putative acetyltransferase
MHAGGAPDDFDLTRLLIRATEPGDAAGVAAMLNHVEVFPGLMQLPFTPMSRWEERLAKRGGEQDCQLVAVYEGQVVGSAGLFMPTPSLRRQHARTLGLNVAAGWQGRGIGRSLMQALLFWADGWAHVLRIELTVYADNFRAQALYRQFGFVEEGRFRAFALRDGCYADTLSMARLHPRPPQLPAQAGGPHAPTSPESP